MRSDGYALRVVASMPALLKDRGRGAVTYGKWRIYVEITFRIDSQIEPEIMTVLSEDQFRRVIGIAWVLSEVGIPLEKVLDDYRTDPNPNCALAKDEAVASVFLTYSAGKSLTIAEKAGLLFVLIDLSHSRPSKGLGKRPPKKKGMPTIKLLYEILLYAELAKHRPRGIVEAGTLRFEGQPRKVYSRIGKRSLCSGIL